MIETHRLVKTYGHTTVLADIDLRVRPGEIVTLAGPNGAGKTTLLRILATLARPTSGSVRIAGLDPARDGRELRRRIGFLSHQTLLYDDLTTEQNLRFYARLYAIDRPEAQTRVRHLMERVGLAARRHDLVRTLSRGMQQRLAIARTVLHRPRLLLLDEPYAGLDTQAAQVMTGLLRDLEQEGGTVLLATHDLARGLAVGKRITVMVRGRLVYDERREAIDRHAFPGTYRRLTTQREGET